MPYKDHSEGYKEFLSEHDRPMETLEDAIMYLVSVKVCGDCSICPRKVYDNDSCSGLYLKAKEILEEKLGLDLPDSFDDVHRDHGNEVIWSYLFNGNNQALKSNGCKGSCQYCDHSEPHASGIRFCNSFHNFVHDDGYCYRSTPSDKMKEEQAEPPKEKKTAKRNAQKQRLLKATEIEVEMPF